MHEASHVLQESTHRDAHATMTSSRCPTAHDHTCMHHHTTRASTLHVHHALTARNLSIRRNSSHRSHTRRTHTHTSAHTRLHPSALPSDSAALPAACRSVLTARTVPQAHTHTHNTHAHTSSSPRHTYYAAPPPPEYSPH